MAVASSEYAINEGGEVVSVNARIEEIALSGEARPLDHKVSEHSWRALSLTVGIRHISTLLLLVVHLRMSDR